MLFRSIRGNADEINFLVHNTLPARGTALTSDAVAQDAARLAGVTHAAVLLTGATDYVAAEGAPLVAVENGAPLMARVAGLGCAQGAIGAAFLGALGGKARWEGAFATALTVALAGERAAAAAKGPGSFMPAFLDALDALTPDDVRKHGKVKIVPKESQQDRQAVTALRLCAVRAKRLFSLSRLLICSLICKCTIKS